MRHQSHRLTSKELISEGCRERTLATALQAVGDFTVPFHALTLGGKTSATRPLLESSQAARKRLLRLQASVCNLEVHFTVLGVSRE